MKFYIMMIKPHSNSSRNIYWSKIKGVSMILITPKYLMSNTLNGLRVVLIMMIMLIIDKCKIYCYNLFSLTRGVNQ